MHNPENMCPFNTLDHTSNHAAIYLQVCTFWIKNEKISNNRLFDMFFGYTIYF